MLNNKDRLIFNDGRHRKLYCGDCRSMYELPDEIIQCVVTSPPYWGLRKYAGDQDLIWGNDNHHNHEWITETRAGLTGGTNEKNIGGWAGGSRGQYTTFKDINTDTCKICNAWRGAFGLEPTPAMYVEHTIEILREIRRVLKKDGVVFINIGDSYAGSGKGIGSDHGKAVFTDDDIPKAKHGYKDGRSNRDKRFSVGGVDDLKPKNLCLIPFRVAIAAQEDGWYVRSVIIWSKPNPMPESVKDRPTNAHEYILMITKSGNYYWNQEVVREPFSETERWSGEIYSRAVKGAGMVESAGLDRERSVYPNEGRNIRSVWEFPTQPFPEAHFAVFPEKLPELCIKAASKEGDIILDPFAGAGTTLKVAAELNRQAIGYELSREYCDLIIKRNRQQVLA